jgi:hypothetical protein
MMMMMSLSVVIIIVIFAHVIDGASLSVGSWNLLNFARGSRTDAQIGMLATVVARYDVIPLQEIRTDDVAVKFLASVLKDELGIDFDSFTSDPVRE